MKTLLAVLAVLAMAVPAMAEDFTVIDEFVFNAPPVTNVIQPVSFKLYFNNFLLCTIPYEADMTSVSCPITLTSVHVNQDTQQAGGMFKMSVEYPD